jgi:hypothetical protein
VPDSDPFSDAEFAKNLACLSSKIAASADRRFQFDKRRQLFIGTNNETLSDAAMRVSNPDRLTRASSKSREFLLASRRTSR